MSLHVHVLLATCSEVGADKNVEDDEVEEKSLLLDTLFPRRTAQVSASIFEKRYGCTDKGMSWSLNFNEGTIISTCATYNLHLKCLGAIWVHRLAT